jgi:hypothetical protein
LQIFTIILACVLESSFGYQLSNCFKSPNCRNYFRGYKDNRGLRPITAPIPSYRLYLYPFNKNDRRFETQFYQSSNEYMKFPTDFYPAYRDSVLFPESAAWNELRKWWPEKGGNVTTEKVTFMWSRSFCFYNVVLICLLLATSLNILLI